MDLYQIPWPIWPILLGVAVIVAYIFRSLLPETKFRPVLTAFNTGVLIVVAVWGIEGRSDPYLWIGLGLFYAVAELTVIHYFVRNRQDHIKREKQNRLVSRLRGEENSMTLEGANRQIELKRDDPKRFGPFADFVYNLEWIKVAFQRDRQSLFNAIAKVPVWGTKVWRMSQFENLISIPLLFVSIIIIGDMLIYFFGARLVDFVDLAPLITALLWLALVLVFGRVKVDEVHQVVITLFGRPIKLIFGAGFHLLWLPKPFMGVQGETQVSVRVEPIDIQDDRPHPPNHSHTEGDPSHFVSILTRNRLRVDIPLQAFVQIDNPFDFLRLGEPEKAMTIFFRNLLRNVAGRMNDVEIIEDKHLISAHMLYEYIMSDFDDQGGVRTLSTASEDATFSPEMQEAFELARIEEELNEARAKRLSSFNKILGALKRNNQKVKQREAMQHAQTLMGDTTRSSVSIEGGGILDAAAAKYVSDTSVSPSKD